MLVSRVYWEKQMAGSWKAEKANNSICMQVKQSHWDLGTSTSAFQLFLTALGVETYMSTSYPECSWAILQYFSWWVFLMGLSEDISVQYPLRFWLPLPGNDLLTGDLWSEISGNRQLEKGGSISPSFSLPLGGTHQDSSGLWVTQEEQFQNSIHCSLV